MPYVNPISDIFVRYLLGSEENIPILKDFINTILEDSGFEKAEELSIRNPFNLATIQEEKETILDIKAQDSHHRIFNVEIQVLPDRYYNNRTLYYWSKLYSDQLSKGNDYEELNPVIAINIVDFILYPQYKKAHSCFLPLEMHHTDVVSSNEREKRPNLFEHFRTSADEERLFMPFTI